MPLEGQPVPSGAQSPGRTWVLPSSFHLRPATPLDKSSIGPFSDIPGRVSGGARKSVLPLPHHIPPQVRASTSLFLDSLLGLPQQSGTCSVPHQNWSGLAHGEL